MQHINDLLTRIKGLTDTEDISLLELDLMMDHTRAMYAALIEKRNELAIAPVNAEPQAEKKEPTLNEYVAAIAEEPVELVAHHEPVYMEIEEEIAQEYEQIEEEYESPETGVQEELFVEEPEHYIENEEHDTEITETAPETTEQNTPSEERITLELPHIPPTVTAPHKIHDTDIRHKIGINDKYQFISELFGNNKEAYEEVLNELNTFETYADGVKWLHSSVYTDYNWHEENETLQMFYAMLAKFYATH